MVSVQNAKMAKERLDLCHECEFYLKIPKLCKKCYCVMPVKVQLANMKCPIGKW